MGSRVRSVGRSSIMMVRVLMIVAIVLGGADVSAQDNRHDGVWWTRQAVGFRLFYVIGFMDGMALGHAFSLPDPAAAPRRDPDPAADAGRVYAERTRRYFGDVSVGQIIDALDEFYRDPKNRFIVVADAIEIVVRAAKGENVDALVRARREAAARK